MFDPFFGLTQIGGPIAVAFLLADARLNPTTIPSVATCLVAMFAAYDVFEWLITLGALFAGAHGLGLTAAAASLAVLFVGVPFALSARARRQRANS